jgi:hypothetical protein
MNGVTMPVNRLEFCQICGIPWDAGYFDESTIREAPRPGETVVLARYQLARNYCGVLSCFAQFTEQYARDNSQVFTPGYSWQVRCNGQPRDPYLSLDHILNPWGQSGMPVHLRLEESCLVELVLRNINVPAGAPVALTLVGGRITGRYWYNNEYGGAPHPL